MSAAHYMAYAPEPTVPLVDPGAGARLRAQLIERGLLTPARQVRSAFISVAERELIDAKPCLLLDEKGRALGQREAEEYEQDLREWHAS